jgi:eukaryotic-like serine/threonine-protein kinase
MRCPLCQADNPESSRFCGGCAAPLGPAGGPSPSLTKTLAAPPQPVLIGGLVGGKYRIVEEVGRGGMGVVYKAEDVVLKRPVALKFLPPHLADALELKERFLIEARAAAALSHPHICVIYEVGEDEGRPCLAMEYVEGETLRDRIRAGALEAADALALASQIAAGLEEAHGKGIVHRDIKSANIMITAKGQAKVMDFGLAKLQGGTSLTKSQTTLGTVVYMSPEQARGEDVDGRTDIWSLGVVLYEMLTGELPFKGDHDQTVIHAILHREPKPPSKLRPGLPRGLDNVVLRAMAKKPAERYQTMEDLREDLGALAEGLKPLRARRPRRTLPGSRVPYLVAGGLAVLAVLFSLDVGGLRHRIFDKGGFAEPGVRLAVLPFANASGDPDQEYLSDGTTQELITQLGRLHPQALSVIARTSVMRYRNAEAPIDQIGRELGVDYVLEGSVGSEAGRLRVAAELIRVTDQTQLWADTFDRELTGVQTVQGQIAKGVAKALAVQLLPSEEARLASARTVDPEAYEASLKGTARWQKLKAADYDEAERLFEIALKEDPSYAPAYAGLAWVWSARRQFGLIPYSETSKIGTLVRQALELDEDSPEAHEILAAYLTWTEWDWAGADPEWKRTLELAPNGANAHAYYAHYLANRGRAAEGLKHSERAIKLDPFNALYHAMYAVVLQYLGRYDDALAAAKAALAIDPGLGIAHTQFQRYFVVKGLRQEQLADQRMRIANDPERVAAFDRGLAEGGYEGAQRAIADVLAARYARTEYHSAKGIALRYLDAGDKDRATEWLYKAFENREQDLAYIGLPEWAPLHDDPRFQALVRRLGLPLPGLTGGE